jgi:hypothetical protein
MWPLAFKHKCCLIILASLCAISKYVVSFQVQVQPHNFGLLVCHQSVCGPLPSSTSVTSQFWPLWVPSVCLWSPSFKHKYCLTILASSFAIRMYVVSFLQAQLLPHNCGLILCYQDVCGLLPSSKVLPHNFGLFVTIRNMLFLSSTPSDCFMIYFFHLSVGILSELEFILFYKQSSFSKFYFYYSFIDCRSYIQFLFFYPSINAQHTFFYSK